MNTFFHKEGHVRIKREIVVLEVQMSASAVDWLLLLKAGKKRSKIKQTKDTSCSAPGWILLFLFPILGVT